MRLENKIEINSSVKRIFETLINGPNEAIWNTSVNNSVPLNSKIIQLSTTLGEMKKIIIKKKKIK